MSPSFVTKTMPLFFLIWKNVGRDWLIASLYAMVVSSLFIDLKKRVQQVDPDAFIIVYDANEVLGKGFGAYQPGSV